MQIITLKNAEIRKFILTKNAEIRKFVLSENAEIRKFILSKNAEIRKFILHLSNSFFLPYVSTFPIATFSTHNFSLSAGPPQIFNLWGEEKWRQAKCVCAFLLASPFRRSTHNFVWKCGNVEGEKQEKSLALGDFLAYMGKML